jgi:hypothetical protein
MSLGILFLDWVTGPYLMFPVLFVIPVALAAWYCSHRLTYALAVLLPLGLFLMDAFWELFRELPIPLVYAAASGLIRIAVLGFIAFLALRAREAALLQERVNVLEGLLPICMFCKSIRDDAGH